MPGLRSSGSELRHRFLTQINRENFTSRLKVVLFRFRLNNISISASIRLRPQFSGGISFPPFSLRRPAVLRLVPARLGGSSHQKNSPPLPHLPLPPSEVADPPLSTLDTFWLCPRSLLHHSIFMSASIGRNLRDRLTCVCTCTCSTSKPRLHKQARQRRGRRGSQAALIIH